MESLVDGVDHVYVPMTNASARFGILSERLELPVLWPFTSFDGFSSGGVSVGSIKLEIIESNALTPWSQAQDPPQVQGIAFRPARTIDEAYLAEVDARAIRGQSQRTSSVGQASVANVYFADFISATTGVFVCDPLPEPRDIARRRRLLAECGGGCMGALDAVQLVISSRSTRVGPTTVAAVA